MRLIDADAIKKLNRIEQLAREAFTFTDPDDHVVAMHRAQALANIYHVFIYGLGVNNA